VSKRKGISKATRFEVFKRDSFTCLYCGAKAPDVVLVVDHIHPVAKGGENQILNLATSCEACNSGKSDRTLDDQSILERQRTQLAQLQAKREQIEMMVEWQSGLLDVADHAVDQICSFYSKAVPGWSLNEKGRANLRAALAVHSLDVVLSELRTAVAKYLRSEDGTPTRESVEIISRAFFNTLKYRKFREQNPVEAELRYIRGILRNRLARCDMDHALELLRDAHAAGLSVEKLRAVALTTRSWAAWTREVLALIATAGGA